MRWTMGLASGGGDHLPAETDPALTQASIGVTSDPSFFCPEMSDRPIALPVAVLFLLWGVGEAGNSRDRAGQPRALPAISPFTF
jgi:hypothetical protein